MPVSIMERVNRNTPKIFFFHTVGEEGPHITNLFRPPSVPQFTAMLDELTRIAKPLEDLSSEGIGKAGSGHFILTFDDGLRGAYERAVPVLEQMGIPAIFFLNPGFMNRKGNYYRFESAILSNLIASAGIPAQQKISVLLAETGYRHPNPSRAILEVRYPDRHLNVETAAILGVDLDDWFRKADLFMTEAEAQDLQERGFPIGAHSIDHPRYADINLEEQVRQTRESVVYVQRRFNLPYRYFAFPFDTMGVTGDFYRELDGEVDLYFTSAGWRRPDLQQAAFHRVGMDNQPSVRPALKAKFRM